MLRREFKPKRKQLYTLALLLVAVIFIMVFIYNSSHREQPLNPFDSSYIRAGGDTLNIAIELNPAVYSVKGDSISGRDYEILQRISEECRVPMKFYPFVPLDHALAGLDDGTFDMVVASLPLTTQLKDKYLMTEPVYLDREILVQRSDSTHTPIKSQVELGGDTVWITSQSPFKERLKNLADEIGDTIYLNSSSEYSAEALFILTAEGKIKYCVINEGIANELNKQFSNIDISTPISFTQFQSWALNKKDGVLCDSINRWIQKVTKQ